MLLAQTARPVNIRRKTVSGHLSQANRLRYVTFSIFRHALNSSGPFFITTCLALLKAPGTSFYLFGTHFTASKAMSRER